MRKTVLIAPLIDFTEDSLISCFTPLFSPPTGVLAVGSYLARHGVPVELVDPQIDIGLGLTPEADGVVARRAAARLAAQADQISWVGLSVCCRSRASDRLIREISGALPGVPIVLGGYAPSNAYEEMLHGSPAISAIVVGDGEEAALRISESLARSETFLDARTPNLAWLESGRLRLSPRRPMDVDDLPNLDFTLLANPSCYQAIALTTSRGCPFRCSYCLERRMRPYKAYSPEWFRRQLEHVAGLGLCDGIVLHDPIFGLGTKRTEELTRIMGEHDFRFACESRGDVVTPEQLRALKGAGMDLLYVGFESASPSTLLRMTKVRSLAEGEEYVRKTLEVLRACFENDVTPVLGLMFAFPGDREEDYELTLSFAKAVRALHDECAERTGKSPGFVPLTLVTGICSGSALEASLASEYPDVVVDPQVVTGSRLVLSPSPGIDEKVTRRYHGMVARAGAYTLAALERLWLYTAYSTSAYVALREDLVDDEGVVVLGDAFRDYSRQFSAEAALLHYGPFFSASSD